MSQSVEEMIEILAAQGCVKIDSSMAQFYVWVGKPLYECFRHETISAALSLACEEFGLKKEEK